MSPLVSNEIDSGTLACARRASPGAQFLGKYSRKAIGIGTSCCAKVSETSTWQFACLPSTPQCCRLTPTECLRCLGSAVSSTIITASLPPTKASAVLRSTCSKGAVHQGEVDTKWWSCCVCPGHTRSAIGSTLFRAPGPISPCKYRGSQQRCSERLKTARNGSSQS